MNKLKVYGRAFFDGLMADKCKISVIKTSSENASIRAKNSDETVVFAFLCGRFSLFPSSKHSFYRPKAMLLRYKSSPFTL